MADPGDGAATATVARGPHPQGRNGVEDGASRCETGVNRRAG